MNGSPNAPVGTAAAGAGHCRVAGRAAGAGAVPVSARGDVARRRRRRAARAARGAFDLRGPGGDDRESRRSGCRRRSSSCRSRRRSRRRIKPARGKKASAPEPVARPVPPRLAAAVRVAGQDLAVDARAAPAFRSRAARGWLAPIEVVARRRRPGDRDRPGDVGVRDGDRHGQRAHRASRASATSPSSKPRRAG